jgi:hypothetical protein
LARVGGNGLLGYGVWKKVHNTGESEHADECFYFNL